MLFLFLLMIPASFGIGSYKAIHPVYSNHTFIVSELGKKELVVQNIDMWGV